MSCQVIIQERALAIKFSPLTLWHSQLQLFGLTKQQQLTANNLVFPSGVVRLSFTLITIILQDLKSHELMTRAALGLSCGHMDLQGFQL